MRIIKDNEELQSMIVDGRIVIDDDIQCNFNIYVMADIEAGNIKAGDINALNIKALNIKASNIDAWDIKALNIDAWDIKAGDIDAGNIAYHAICVAYKTFKCKSVNGRRENAKHFCLDSEIIIKGE